MQIFFNFLDNSIYIIYNKLIVTCKFLLFGGSGLMSCTFPEFLDSVKNKNVSVVGVGISNTPVISLLAKAGANVCAYDKNSEQDLGDIAH